MTSRIDPSGTRSGSKPRAVLTSLPGAAAGLAFLSAGWTVDATMTRAAMAIRDMSRMNAPVRLVLSFGRPLDAELFEGQYQARHLSLVLAMPLVVSVESALVACAPATRRARYHWVTTVTFNSVSDMVRCLSSRPGQLTLADVAAFATGGVTARIVTVPRSVRATTQAQLPPTGASTVPRDERPAG